MKALPKALWMACPGVVNEGIGAHARRDTCSSCAPWWEIYPICPLCGTKITRQTKSGRVLCDGCRHFIDTSQRPDRTDAAGWPKAREA